MSALITLEEAWDKLLALAEPLVAETIAVDETLGRHLTADLIARRTQPDADLSVMDGYAVAGEAPWRIVGESRAGAPYAASLSSDEAVRISTGAACPTGTTAILVSEDALVDGAVLTAAQAPEPGRWVRRRGFDFAEGTTVLDRGRRIGPAQLALARAAGHGSLTVAKRPLVAVLEMGDELVADPASCPPGFLPASNGAMVAAMVAGIGVQALRSPSLPDDRAAIAAAIAADAEADVIVTTAGASVGDHDHVRAALDELGAELAFWRVAIRPGRPLMVGRLGHQIVLGLPGNPASSFVTAFLFLLPLLRALQGATRPLPTTIPLPLALPMEAGGARREFRRAYLDSGQAVPLPERDSSALATLAAADLLIDRPIGATEAPAGTLVPCYWLESGGVA